MKINKTKNFYYGLGILSLIYHGLWVLFGIHYFIELKNIPQNIWIGIPLAIFIMVTLGGTSLLANWYILNILEKCGNKTKL